MSRPSDAGHRGVPAIFNLFCRLRAPVRALVADERRPDREAADLILSVPASGPPLVLVRLGGLDEIRARYGPAVAERITVALNDRVRASLRRDDTVTGWVPTELLIRLSGDVSEEDAMVVVGRLEAALAKAVAAVSARHARLLSVTVELVRPSFANGRLGWESAGGGGRPVDVAAPAGNEVTLPAGPVSEFASNEEFVERLRTLAGRGDGQWPVPLVLVRLGGLDQLRARHGSATADRIIATMSHRVRASVRRTDTVARFLPTELLILLSGDVSAENAMVVLRRLEAVLADPIVSVRRPHRRLLNPTVALVQGTLANGRFHLVVDGVRLLDAPVAVESARGRPTRTRREGPYDRHPR